MTLDLRSILVSNGTGVVLLLLLLYVSRTRIQRHRTEDRIYFFMVVGVMLACIVEAGTYIIDGQMFPGARFISFILNTYLYTVNVLLSLCVLMYVDIGLYGDRSRIWRNYKPQLIAALLMLIANVVNIFTPVSFKLTADNIYHRTAFSYVYYVVIFYFCISAMILTKRYEKENGAKSFLNINMFIVPIIIGASLQFMFYGLSLAWLSSAIGLMGLFTMQQNEAAYIDTLSEIYNRQFLNQVLYAWVSRGISFSGVMFDIDSFKQINDNFGHSEGDAAIKATADILMQSRLDNELVFRYAGDEFIVLKMADSEDELGPYIQSFNQHLAAFNNDNHSYQLALSYGKSFFKSGTTDDFMKSMDEQMYLMKTAHHSN